MYQFYFSFWVLWCKRKYNAIAGSSRRIFKEVIRQIWRICIVASIFIVQRWIFPPLIIYSSIICGKKTREGWKRVFNDRRGVLSRPGAVLREAALLLRVAEDGVQERTVLDMKKITRDMRITFFLGVFFYLFELGINHFCKLTKKSWFNINFSK